MFPFPHEIREIHICLIKESKPDVLSFELKDYTSLILWWKDDRTVESGYMGRFPDPLLIVGQPCIRLSFLTPKMGVIIFQGCMKMKRNLHQIHRSMSSTE